MENVSTSNYQMSMMSSAHTESQPIHSPFTLYLIRSIFFRLIGNDDFRHDCELEAADNIPNTLTCKNTFTPAPLTESVKIGNSHFDSNIVLSIDIICEQLHTKCRQPAIAYLQYLYVGVYTKWLYLYKLQTRKIFVYWTVIACKACTPFRHGKHPHPSQ